MLYRLRQLLAAIRAKISPAEEKWVNEKLPDNLRPLFWNMDVVDQRHCLDVTKTALGLYQGSDISLLTVAGLLHDCGKTKGDLSIMDRGLVVVGSKLMGDKIHKFSQRGKGFGHALWIHENHPQRGAELIKEAGGSLELCQLIEVHHHSPDSRSSLEHIALYLADGQN